MGRPLFSYAYSSPAVRVEPEQPQPYEKWSPFHQFDPDSDAFLDNAEDELICTPEPEGIVRGASPAVVEEVDSASSSEAGTSGRGSPTNEDDDLSIEELELDYRRRRAVAQALRAVSSASPVSPEDDGQTYRAVARPHTSYVRTSYPADRTSRSPSPHMAFPRAQVMPEPIHTSPIVTRSNPIPIPAPARPTTPLDNTPSYSLGSPSPPPSVTPRLYTWARSALPVPIPPSSPLPNRSARMSFANISASPSTARIVF
ncbi:hypothetical protein PHLGIDRAFT_127840 [Phlebiopsis gigantea 11061_1 CR5-6]|uniref:Uncharacterized protein n=1 Tax=Phlebiopsis gigantea (strain 11061_1 CR5-6) TaxID=745531 RepID=A0A0C3SAK7_PHLG1|nr:hypothetical protein PHLGIDRAFT_127840 [Phlebiopsis gigantea 11061_1 CR5-6]